MNNLKESIKFEQMLRDNADVLDYKRLEEFVLKHGFKTLSEYFDTKRFHLFTEWCPEVYYIDIADYAEVTEDAITTGKYGVYISNGAGIHAYHGNLPIDYDLCKALGVRVVELNYGGGTIIGSADDFSIIVVFPPIMSMNLDFMLSKFKEIISKYVPDVTIANNDILVGGNKVAGSMTRECPNAFVWATQVSFRDYSEYIEKICQKKQLKKPAFIDSTLLDRNTLEKEIIAWLRKEDID
jgi:hypothetical protein